jgi:hypothetical protein
MVTKTTKTNKTTKTTTKSVTKLTGGKSGGRKTAKNRLRSPLKKITPKNKSDKEQFYCVSCKANVRKDRADKNIYIKQAKNGRWMMRSSCGSCNTNLTRFISNADAEAWTGAKQ